MKKMHLDLNTEFPATHIEKSYSKCQIQDILEWTDTDKSINFM